MDWSTVMAKEIPRLKSENSEAEEKSHRAEFDILRNIMPIYHISKICGLLPVRFVLDKAGKHSGRVDYPQFGYGILLVLALTSGQCYGLYRDLRDGWQNSTRLSSESSITVTVSDVFAVMSVAVVAILGSPRRWYHLQRALRKLVENNSFPHHEIPSSSKNFIDISHRQVDEKLGIPTLSKLRKLSISVISGTLTCLVVISTLDFVSWGVSATSENSDLDGAKGPINYIFMYLMYVVIVALELQYATVLFGVGESFRKLNCVVEKLTKADSFRNDISLGNGKTTVQNPRSRLSLSLLADLEPPHRSNRQLDKSNDVYPRKTHIDVAEAIDQLITLHGTLCDAVDCVNRAYGTAILVGTISCLIHLIITPYFLYNRVYSRNPNNWLLLFLQMFWILFHACRMLLFVQPCHMVGIKSKKTGTLVNEALATKLSPGVEKQLRIFSIQLLQRPIEFSACGLFYLNRELMTSIAGSVTTYLVILVQFQTADDTKGTKNMFENASELLKNVSSFKNIFQIK